MVNRLRSARERRTITLLSTTPQVRDEHAEHGPIRKLVEGGQLAPQGAIGGNANAPGKGILPGADGRGHGPTSVCQNRGDR